MNGNNDPQYKRCPDCGDPTEWDRMIWLDGRCTCPACYAERRRLIDAEKEEKEVKQTETKPVCPLCGQEYDGPPALSREDNQTQICPDCATRQALTAIGVQNQDAVIARIHAYEEHTRK